MAYSLRDNLSYAIVSRWTVFLDVAGDRYACLGCGAGHAPAKIAAGEQLQPVDHQAASTLIKAGLVRPSEDAGSAPRPVAIACVSSVFDAPCASSPGRDLTGVLLALAHYRQDARLTSLGDRIRALKEHKNRSSLRRSDASLIMRRVATAFDRASLMLGCTDRCLPRSFALAHRLADLGVQVDLVFGVTTDPFSAHCWVQHDGVVLNDHLDPVRNFTHSCAAAQWDRRSRSGYVADDPTGLWRLRCSEPLAIWGEPGVGSVSCRDGSGSSWARFPRKIRPRR